MTLSVIEFSEASTASSTSTLNVALAATPISGDIIIMMAAMDRTTTDRLVNAVSGAGGTWSQLHHSTASSNYSHDYWIGTGANASGNVLVTLASARDFNAYILLIRGFTGTPTSAVVAASASSGTSLAGSSQTATLDEFVCSMGSSVPALTWPSAQNPAASWTTKTPVTPTGGGFAHAAGYTIPGSSATHNTSLTSTTSGKMRITQVVLTGPPATTGTVAATLPALTAAVDGLATIPGTVDATLPALTAQVDGLVTITGIVDVTLPALSAAIMGDVTGPVTGDVAVMLPPLTAQVDGLVSITGTIAATLPSLAASLTGEAPTVGAVAATLPRLTASIVADSGEPTLGDLIGVGDDCVPGLLGSGTNKVFLYDRGGRRRIVEITPTTLVRWNRVRDGISDATIRVVSPDAACCEVLSKIHAGRHEIVIFRDGNRVWEGPVTRVAWMARQVEISASDVMHYAARTAMHYAYDNRNVGGVNKIGPVTRRAQNILMNELVRKESIDPPINVLPHLTVRTSPQTTLTSKLTLPFEATVFEEIDRLAAKAGLDYTTIGRRIFINDVYDTIGRTQMLTDKDFDHELIVTQYGMELCTRSIVTDGAGRWAAVGGIDPYYGEVELLHTTYGETGSTVNETPTAAELAAMERAMISQAQRNLAGRYPSPTVVRVPDNSTLLPTAPVTMEELVAGVRVPIRATLTCVEAMQEQKLDRLVVEQTEAGETVQVTLSPAPGTTPWDDTGDSSASDTAGGE